MERSEADRQETPQFLPSSRERRDPKTCRLYPWR